MSISLQRDVVGLEKITGCIIISLQSTVRIEYGCTHIKMHTPYPPSSPHTHRQSPAHTQTDKLPNTQRQTDSSKLVTSSHLKSIMMAVTLSVEPMMRASQHSSLAALRKQRFVACNTKRDTSSLCITS